MPGGVGELSACGYTQLASFNIAGWNSHFTIYYDNAVGGGFNINWNDNGIFGTFQSPLRIFQTIASNGANNC